MKWLPGDHIAARTDIWQPADVEMISDELVRDIAKPRLFPAEWRLWNRRPMARALTKVDLRLCLAGHSNAQRSAPSKIGATARTERRGRLALK
jgi:hypothetical protein